MLGSHPISAILGADIAADSDTSSLRAYVKALADVGLFVLLCEQGTKIPADYRTPKQKEEDLAKFREEVGAPDGVDIGQPRGGIYLATNDATRLRSYVAKFRKDKLTEKTSPLTFELKELEKKSKKGGLTPEEVQRCADLQTLIDNTPDNAPLNLAVEVGNSRIIVVDCDTAAQKNAFCKWWSSKSGDPSVTFALPTVLSPGVCENGVWKHKDGGHYYFTLDTFIMPKNAGKMTVEFEGESFDVFWRDRYVLIPPSVRAEGPYRRVGPVLSLTEHRWLEQEITRYCEAKAVRPRAAEGMSEESQTALIDWYNNTTWSDLLVPHGWEWTGVDNSCGCPVWGRPGGRSSDKSATAHEPGCGRAEYNSEDPPIHFWTSMPGKEITDKLADIGAGANTLSKLQLFAALEHRGDDGEALRSIPGVRRTGTRSVPVEGMPFNTSRRVELTDGDDGGDDGTGDNGERYALAPTSPSPVMVSAPYAPQQGAPYPVTEGVTPHVHPSYVQVPSSQGDVSSKTLVGPGAFMPPQNTGAVHDFVTPGVTPVVTGAVTPIVTGVPTQGVTENEAPRYDPRYGNAPQQGQPAPQGYAPTVQGHHFPAQAPEAAPRRTSGFDIVPDFDSMGGGQAVASPAYAPAAPTPMVFPPATAYDPNGIHGGAPQRPAQGGYAAGYPTAAPVAPSVPQSFPGFPQQPAAHDGGNLPQVPQASVSEGYASAPAPVAHLSAEDRQAIVTDVASAVLGVLRQEGVIK